jgi:DNA-binding NarL/FixJ family response regulator
VGFGLVAFGALWFRRRHPVGVAVHEVALAVGRGCSNADIAAELHMSVATVKAHVSRLLAKLDLDNRVQIALLVQDAGR